MRFCATCGEPMSAHGPKPDAVTAQMVRTAMRSFGRQRPMARKTLRECPAVVVDGRVVPARLVLARGDAVQGSNGRLYRLPEDTKHVMEDVA